MKIFRNAFLVTAVASATLLGWGCKEGGEARPGTQDPAGQQETGGTGGAGGDVGGTGSGTGGTGDVGESGDMGPGTRGDEIRSGREEGTGSETGTQPEPGR